MDENALSEILTGFSSGYSKAQAERQKFKQALQQDLQKAMLLQQMKQESGVRGWKPRSMEEAIQVAQAKRAPSYGGPQIRPLQPVTAPEGYEVTQYDVQGRPLIKKIDEVKQQKILAGQKSADTESEMIRSDAQNSLDTISEIKKGMKYFGKATTPIPALYGTPKAVWESNINRLLSQKVLDLIMKMKSASKTGATGFGQLSEKEGMLLREASTALNKKLPEAKALEYLNGMENIYKKILNGGSSKPDINSMAGPRDVMKPQGEQVPSGYKKQVNRRTGETRIVPINQ